jgi:hypothetical protein
MESLTSRPPNFEARQTAASPQDEIDQQIPTEASGGNGEDQPHHGASRQRKEEECREKSKDGTHLRQLLGRLIHTSIIINTIVIPRGLHPPPIVAGTPPERNF